MLIFEEIAQYNSLLSDWYQWVAIYIIRTWFSDFPMNSDYEL